MRLQLPPELADRPDAREAQRIIGQCVHCGFCTAVCPTYRLSGEELEGPRGRIRLIGSALAGEPVGAVTRDHLDSCLGCRACESACPSGVQYGRLIDIGRNLVEERLPPSAARRGLRKLALRVLMQPRLFAALLRVGRVLRALLPAPLARHLPRVPLATPASEAPASEAPASEAPVSAAPVPGAATAPRRRMILLDGCVQPALMPNVNAAAQRVLARFGIETVTAPRAGCCGALPLHAGEESLGLAAVRRNVDAWWPLIEQGAEALVMTASGCGLTVRDYGRLLAQDAEYSSRAARIAAMTRDLVEIVAAEVDRHPSAIKHADIVRPRVIFHPPCTLQHGQLLAGEVERLLADLGATVLPLADAGLCCGSAGTYSLRHPAIANELRARKLAVLERDSPEEILSANVGCIAHLASPGRPVRHWIEWLDQRLAGARAGELS